MDTDTTTAAATAAAAAAAAASGNALQPPAQQPRDARLVAIMLQAMGVEDFDARVVPQLLELMHRYVLDVVADAQLFAEHAGRGGGGGGAAAGGGGGGGGAEIDVEDLRLAVEGKTASSFTSLPSKEVLSEIAESRNTIPLPLVPKRFGVRLPPEHSALTGSNFRIVPKASRAPAPRPPPPRAPSRPPGTTSGPATAALHAAFAPPATFADAPAPPPMMVMGSLAAPGGGLGGDGGVGGVGAVAGGRAGGGYDDYDDAMEEDGDEPGAGGM